MSSTLESVSDFATISLSFDEKQRVLVLEAMQELVGKEHVESSRNVFRASRHAANKQPPDFEISMHITIYAGSILFHPLAGHSVAVLECQLGEY